MKSSERQQPFGNLRITACKRRQQRTRKSEHRTQYRSDKQFLGRGRRLTGVGFLQFGEGKIWKTGGKVDLEVLSSLKKIRLRAINRERRGERLWEWK